MKDQFYEVIKILNSEIDILKIEKEIDNKVQENIAKTQRKFIIQEQIKILQDELGDEEEATPEFVKMKETIKKAKMPKEAEDQSPGRIKQTEKNSSYVPGIYCN